MRERRPYMAVRRPKGMGYHRVWWACYLYSFCFLALPSPLSVLLPVCVSLMVQLCLITRLPHL